MNVKDIKTFEELMDKIKAPEIKNAYHYTTLESLSKIVKNKSLKLSGLRTMNDGFEMRLYGNCHDLFFCLSKSSISKESFGMWAMYGKLRTKEKDEMNPNNIGVKICFPKNSIDEICRINSLVMHSVAYADLRTDYQGNPLKKVTIGSQTTSAEIKLDLDNLEGYIKDSAWAYENEIRLRKKNEDVLKDDDIISLTDDIISQLIVYPSPRYEADTCKKILGKLGCKIMIEDNIYRKAFCERVNN